VLAAIILAAGESSRMGTPKALLRDRDGEIFIRRIVRSLADAGLASPVVVTGRHHALVVEALSESALPAVRVVRNPDPARGQLSSLWAGMDEACRPEIHAIVVTLVDVPLVAPSTIHSVIEAWRRTRAPIVRPAVGVRRGHPVIFDRAVFDELRRAPVDAGARVVVRAHFDEIIDVPVDDPGCIVDVDTPEDYRDLIERRT
jgi:molybdenum cofactor cytidylyltransferase